MIYNTINKNPTRDINNYFVRNVDFIHLVLFLKNKRLNDKSMKISIMEK